MITIFKKDNGRYTILNSRGEDILYDDFYKIERLNEHSYIYLLHENERAASFYLYHINILGIGRYLFEKGTCHTKNVATRFSNIEDYSIRTKTFIAHVSDDSTTKCLIKDDENVMVISFRYIGAECAYTDRRGSFYSRPVQFHGRIDDNRFGNTYFNCGIFRAEWKNPYKQDVNTVLGTHFDNGYFTFYNKIKRSYTLAFYNFDEHRLHNRFHKYNGIEYDEIEKYKNYLICKIRNNNLFNIYNTNNYEENIGTFAGRYDEIEDGLLRFKSSDNSHWVLFKTRSAKVIENINWTIEKDIEVLDNVIFHGSNDTGWKIYSFEDFEEIYTGWENIRLTKCNNNIKIIVDTNEQIGHELFNVKNEIEDAYYQFLKSLSSELPIIPETEEVKEEPVSVVKEKDSTEKTLIIPPTNGYSETSIKEEPRETKSKQEVEQEVEFDYFPEKIDFVCIFDQIRKSNYNHLICTRKTSNLAPNDIILFIDENNKSSYCCKYIRKGFNILWHKSNLKVDQKLIDSLNNKENKKAFHRINLTGFDENNVFSRIVEELEKKIVDIENSKENEDQEQYNKIFDFLAEQNFEKDIILKALKVLMPDVIPNFSSHKNVENNITFTFDNNNYTVYADSPWSIDNPFRNRRFLRKNDIVFVCIDQKVFKEYPNSDNYDYEMFGEGMDGNQHFASNSNGDIKDSKKRVLLFKKLFVESLSDAILLFFDEVEYVSHEFIDDKDRKIINFHLKSKFRKKQNKK